MVQTDRARSSTSPPSKDYGATRRIPSYGAYKAAVVQFTRCLAVQIGNAGVRVNGIAPDVTESLQVPYSELGACPSNRRMWPLWVPVGRMGLPEDQARVSCSSLPTSLPS